MTLNNDTCDFCGEYVDPIGGDMAIATWYRYGGLFDDIPRDELWCGGCRGGRRMVDYYNRKLEFKLAMLDFKRELDKVMEWLLKLLPAKLVGRDGKEK